MDFISTNHTFPSEELLKSDGANSSDSFTNKLHLVIETLLYTQKEVTEITGHAGSEISNWKLMIDQFTSLKIQNEEETKRLLRSSEAKKPEVQKEIEIMQTLNATLDDAIDECLDQILRNQQRIHNLLELTHSN